VTRYPRVTLTEWYKKAGGVLYTSPAHFCIKLYLIKL
jgi:hypothetical protein